jgi:uncharacterized membrane protein (DUF106 family)
MENITVILLMSSILTLLLIGVILFYVVKIVRQMTIRDIDLKNIEKKTEKLSKKLTEFEKNTELKYERTLQNIKNIQIDINVNRIITCYTGK